uniref:Endoplasmic reticulum-Golgi intermediate compartment protein 2 n=1 Tax=Lepeophtheirus salmonis TaxID=72036 RepID=C1BT41_LEPSM|nr:Endoplasmic reticulum-Golgi intermediate compartment protein 2 [Lepeophtheirus salmonis]
MVLRQRRKIRTLDKIVKELDAFPKVPETYVEKTASGAAISIITTILVIVLLCSETSYFMDPGINFRFIPDTDFKSKLEINVDITIATPCKAIGADVLDVTNNNAFKFGTLKEEDTWFDLDRVQRQHFEAIRTFNKYLREEYHAIQNLLWKSGSLSLYGELPPRRVIPDEPHDACRIHGSLTLNKVAGNFHISPGKTLPLFRAHVHFATFGGDEVYNFTHRIDRFSFGTPHGGIVQPLEGEEKIAMQDSMHYQYLIQVVPTDIQGYTDLIWSTYQYSVKEHKRATKERGSGDTPGIYFKYDMSALKVLASQDREPIFKFLVRLLAAVGGRIATSQIVCVFIKSMIEKICCKLSETKKEVEKTDQLLSSTVNQI